MDFSIEKSLNLNQIYLNDNNHFISNHINTNKTANLYVPQLINTHQEFN